MQTMIRSLIRLLASVVDCFAEQERIVAMFPRSEYRPAKPDPGIILRKNGVDQPPLMLLKGRGLAHGGIVSRGALSVVGEQCGEGSNVSAISPLGQRVANSEAPGRVDIQFVVHQTAHGRAGAHKCRTR